MRATTRDPSQAVKLAEAGVEGIVADPDRIATLIPALEHVGAACILLGSATGSREALEALHGGRLEMLLLRMLDTTVRGIVYEAVGTVDPTILAAGGERVREFCEDSRIPYELLDDDRGPWPGAAADAVDRVLAPR